MTKLSANPRALIVDDEPICRKMVVFALGKEGFACETAGDGMEALAKLKSGNFELVVTDLKMPKLNGGELIVEILKRDRPPLVIVHTSVLSPEVARGLIDEGVDDIVFKPVDYASFAAKTRALLNRRRLRAVSRERDALPVSRFGNRSHVVELDTSSIQEPGFDELRQAAAFGDLGMPEQVGKYRLIRELGDGGMGRVYEAEHVLLKRSCAVKMIRQEYTSVPAALARFEREVRAMASLSHANTVRVFDYGSSETGQFYYVMELLDGMTLTELVRRNGPLSAHRAIHHIVEICDALSEAHQAGLVHRDLKPDNVMSVRTGAVSDVTKVLDFGLVRGPDSNFGPSSDLTLENSLIGSPKYIAPEQVIDPTAVDCRADIYSLGATAYFLLTGIPPFIRSTPFETAMAHVADSPANPSMHNSQIPPRLENVVLTCLAKSPQDRFQSMTELRDALA